MREDGRLVFVDLFAGCGGLSLGMELAGFEAILFSELNTSAAETYMANRPDVQDLWVRNVNDLTESALMSHWQPKWLREGIAGGEVDLLCGGPPCQGYSETGHRRSYRVERREVPSNHLYLRMIDIIRVVKPKMFLFENVRGITFGRWTADGEKGEIWADVQQAFKTLADYHVPDGVQLRCGDYGVPQNRPRVMIVGIRKDVIRRSGVVGIADGLLPAPQPASAIPSICDVLSDLVDPNYADSNETAVYPCPVLSEIQRYYRMNRDGVGIARKGSALTEHVYSSHSKAIRTKFQHMIENAGQIREDMRTKKFGQRLLPTEWPTSGPNITVTSLPDDFVHYKQPRTPTVREWARLQTFPDWYVFKGPRTTGGHRRAGIPTRGIWDREVPKYTQIGNAVPVLLAYEIGKHFAVLLQAAASKRTSRARTAKETSRCLVR